MHILSEHDTTFIIHSKWLVILIFAQSDRQNKVWRNLWRKHVIFSANNRSLRFFTPEHSPSLSYTQYYTRLKRKSRFSTMRPLFWWAVAETERSLKEGSLFVKTNAALCFARSKWDYFYYSVQCFYRSINHSRTQRGLRLPLLCINSKPVYFISFPALYKSTDWLLIYCCITAMR